MLEIINRIVVNVVLLGAYMLVFGIVVKHFYLDRHFTSKSAGRYIVEDFIHYYISAIMVIQISEYLYYEFAENIMLNGIFKTILTAGFFLTLIQICAGKMIDAFYMFTQSEKYKKLRKDRPDNIKEMKDNEKTYIICWSCIATMIISLVFNYRIIVYAISIFLGRFFWFDSTIGRENTIKKYFKDIFAPMNGQDEQDNQHRINGSIIQIKNMVIIGGILWAIIYLPIIHFFGYKIGMF